MAAAPSQLQFNIQDPRNRPPPGPPKYLKHQVYEDPHIFFKIDEHALRVFIYYYYFLNFWLFVPNWLKKCDF